MLLLGVIVICGFKPTSQKFIYEFVPPPPPSIIDLPRPVEATSQLILQISDISYENDCNLYLMYALQSNKHYRENILG